MALDLSKVNFLDDSETFIKHEVAGDLKRFYPLSVRRMSLFQKHAAKLAAAVRDMMYSYAEESGSEQRVNNHSGAGINEQHVKVLPLAPESSEKHRRFRMDSMSSVVEDLLDPDLMGVFGQLILDSMRDEFPDRPAKGFSKADGSELVDAMPLPVFLECCVGVVKANMDAFGPFGKRVAQKAAESMQKMATNSSE